MAAAPDHYQRKIPALPAVDLVSAAHSTDAIKDRGSAVGQNASTKFLRVWTNRFEVSLSLQSCQKPPVCMCWWGPINACDFEWDPSTIIHSFPVWCTEPVLGAFGSRYWFELRSCDYYSCCARTHRNHGGQEIASSTWCVWAKLREKHSGSHLSIHPQNKQKCFI